MNEFKIKKQYFNKKTKTRLKIYLKLIKLILILLGLVLLGFHFISSTNTDNTATLLTSESSITYEDNFSYTDNIYQEIPLLKEQLAEYIKKFKGIYGIYYYNLSTHEEFGINEEEEYVAASTIKIPLNLYLYTKITSGEVNPKGILPYLKEDYETGTGKLQYRKFGETYTVEELSRLSIVNSDNVAANIIFRFLGKWNVKEYMSQVGGKIINDFKNLSSPKDMALYMKLVYEFYLNDKVYGKDLMESFLNTEFNDRLPKYLPKTVQIAHKIGTQRKVINDVGIVFLEKPYIISVMSKDINENEASEVIANLSKKIYLSVTDREPHE
jgi:beta-lactamase class A